MIDDLLRLVRLQDLDLMMDAFADPQRQELESSWGFTPGNLNVLRSQRDELAATIDAALVDRYSRLRLRHRRAVAVVRNGVCLGCFVRVPASLAGRARAVAITCESCGRILVVSHDRGPRIREVAPPAQRSALV